MPVYGSRLGGLLEAHCGAWVVARGQGDFHFLTIHPPHERNTIGAVGEQPFSPKCRAVCVGLFWAGWLLCVGMVFLSWGDFMRD